METPVPQERETYLKQLRSHLQELFGSEAVSIEPIDGGTNNVLHKVIRENGEAYVAKQYFQDHRQRLEREFAVLSALSEKGFTEVPSPVARFDDLHAALYSFIDGRRRESAAFTNHELDAVASYLAKLHTLAPKDVPPGIPMGIASALSLADISRFTIERMQFFQGASAAALDPRISRFLAETHALSVVTKALTAREERFRARLTHRLPDEYQRLSSVDFGPHNMLWRQSGSLVVLDFEYGGWDHPLRVIGDTLSHDQMKGLSAAQKDYFVQQYLASTSLPEEVTCDLEGFCAFSEVDWAMVMLYSILPDKIARLQYSKGSEYDVDAFLERQMGKIRERLKALTEHS